MVLSYSCLVTFTGRYVFSLNTAALRGGLTPWRLSHETCCFSTETGCTRLASSLLVHVAGHRDPRAMHLPPARSRCPRGGRPRSDRQRLLCIRPAGPTG